MSGRAPRGPRLGAVAKTVAGPILAVLAAGGTVAGAQALVGPELRQEATRVLGELATIRGLPPPAGPPALVIETREERRRFVVGEFRRKYSPARLDAERRALVAWHLVPAEFDLAGFLADLLAEQAAAYYDPVRKRLVLANWLTPELRQDALAHELVHVLQDRLVGVERFLAGRPGHSDEGLARQALVEGEAVALQHELRLRREGRELGRLPDVVELQRAIRTSATGPVLARAPAYVRAMLLFPYAEGLGFVHAFRQRQPWSALSAIYQDPPRSASQILHPERYLDRREDPVPLELPDLASVLPAGSAKVIEDELGEFGLGEALRRFHGDGAATGWRGDRYALWDVPPGPPVLISLTAWDTPERAGDFARAYGRILVAKHGLAPVPSGPGMTWTAGPRAFLVEARGRAVADRGRRAGRGRRRPPRGGLGAPGAILTAPRCPRNRRRFSSGCPTPMPTATTRSTTWCRSSPASAR